MVSVITSCIIVFLLLFLSALFSASETAFTSISKAQMHRLFKEGKRTARYVQIMQQNLDRLLSAILLVNTLVNICGTALMTGLLMSFLGESGIGLATVLMTFLILTFSEVMPKVYALKNPEKIALRLGLPLYFIYIFLSPFVSVIRYIVTKSWRLFGVVVDEAAPLKPAREDLLYFLEMYSDLNQQKEVQMLQSVLDLSEVSVSEVMLHRKDMFTLSGDLTVQEAFEITVKSPHTRFPIYKEGPTDIIGTLHIKALMTALKVEPAAKIYDLCRKPAWFIPETKLLLHQLQSFRTRKEHMAFVVDEYGDLQGLITLEDILEEIVGDIIDEYDRAPSKIHVRENNTIVLDGHTTIRDFNRSLNQNLPDEEAATLAGLLIHEAEDVPTIGQIFHFHGLRFEVLKKEKNRILLIKVTILKNDTLS